MKYRMGFVSNSSSSSFIIEKSKLSQAQIKAIRNHIEHALENKLSVGTFGRNDGWHIVENAEVIGGHTIMANFQMDEFLERIGVDLNQVELEGQYVFEIYGRLAEIEKEQERDDS